MKHISYSQYSTYKKCPRSWYLGKVIGAPERPAWYTIIGSVVHKMVEDWLNPDIPFTSMDWMNGGPRAESYAYPLITSARKAEPDTSQWMHSLDGDGNPLTERRAIDFIQLCFERALEFLEDIDVWEVEYDASGFLPECDPEIKAFIDIIGEHKKHGPIILDWKTGKSKDSFQLETYAALMKEGVPGEGYKGYFAMLAPWAPQSRYKDLSAVNPAEVGAKYQDTWLSMRAKLYKTTHTEAVCGFCFQRDNCLLRSEDKGRAEYYDRSSEDGFPF